MFVYVQREILTNYQLLQHICCTNFVKNVLLLLLFISKYVLCLLLCHSNRTLFTVICFTIYFSIYKAFIFSAGVILTWLPRVVLYSYHLEKRFVAFWASYLLTLNVCGIYIFLYKIYVHYLILYTGIYIYIHLFVCI